MILMKVLLVSILVVNIITGNIHGESPDISVHDDAQRIVAKVGEYDITVGDLFESYEIGPAFVKLLPDPLESHLRYMIYEHLLAHEAITRGYDITKFFNDRLFAIEEDLTVDELYHDEILSSVELTEENIYAGIAKARVNMRLRWLFAESKYEAEQLYEQYHTGVPFDSLFARQMLSADGNTGRKLETTQLFLERDNMEFARQLYDVKTQEVSEPIEGPDGYYIVRIDELWQNPILPGHEYQQLKEQAITVLTQLKADELSERYVQRLIQEENPEIIINGMNVVRAYLAEQGLTDDQIEDWDIPLTLLTEGGPQKITETPEFLEIPVATSLSLTLTAQDYLEWFDIRQFQLKRSSRELFNASIMLSVKKMMQDKLLSREAYTRGLHERERVVHEVRKWKAKLLYTMMRRAINRSIEISDAMIESYYTRNRNRFKDEQGELILLADVREEITGELFYREFAQRLRFMLQRLEDEIPVEIDKDLITKLSEEIVEDEPPINVMFYKPAGTFPRVAYPTIDQMWRDYDN